MIQMSEKEQRLAAEASRYDPLPIDPFGAWPQQASKLPGLGGPLLPKDPAYVFKTLQIRPALGRVVFTISLIGLKATHGTLVIRITSMLMVAEALPVPVKTVPILLTELAGKAGIIEIAIESKRNVYYGVTGHIFDETDASAEGISVVLDRREESETERVRPNADELLSMSDASPGKIRSRPDMVSLAPPVLARPASQPFTKAQCKEKSFRDSMASLSRKADPSPQNWIDAYILQVLRHFVETTPGKRALGIGATGTDIPEYLAGRGCGVLLASVKHSAPGEHQQLTDPVDAEADLSIKSVGPVDLLSMPGQFSDLDFLFSVGVPNSIPDGHSAFPKFLAESIICLNPGGVALHIFDYSATLDPAQAPGAATHAYSRSEVERMALAIISHGQEVSQLKFTIGADYQPKIGGTIPFGIIARRKW